MKRQSSMNPSRSHNSSITKFKGIEILGKSFKIIVLKILITSKWIETN
jgi:hypothetical protein